jgi:hypothetical protein
MFGFVIFHILNVAYWTSRLLNHVPQLDNPKAQPDGEIYGQLSYGANIFQGS